jgi:16S rRNA (cytosine967-C5)-methyltransferase
MGDARDVVTKRIASEFKRFPNIGLKKLDVADLVGRDAALARAIDHAIRRRWITLSTLISHASTRETQELDAPVGAVLLVATAQLFQLDRIPDHAVINCAVDWIRDRGKRPKATGFVNAVLRKITRLRGSLIESGTIGQANHFLRSDGSAWELTENVFADGVASQTGFPQKAWARLVKERGEKTSTQIALGSIAEPPLIVALPPTVAIPPNVTPHEDSRFGVINEGVDLESLFVESPTLRVQDPTSAGSLDLLKNLKPRRILDLCAGRGTKTKQLRELFPDAMIGATEPNDERRMSLTEVAKEIDVAVYATNTGGPTEQFDLVVVDTPCSNSGVFARRPEAKLRYDGEHVASLVELQRTILRDAIPILQNKGHLLYTTCSIDHAENDAQIQWLTTKHLMRTCLDTFTLPSGRPGSDPTRWHDGGFAALLQAR